MFTSRTIVNQRFDLKLIRPQWWFYKALRTKTDRRNPQWCSIQKCSDNFFRVKDDETGEWRHAGGTLRLRLSIGFVRHISFALGYFGCLCPSRSYSPRVSLSRLNTVLIFILTQPPGRARGDTGSLRILVRANGFRTAGCLRRCGLWNF